MNVGIVCGYDLDSDLFGYVARLAPHIERERLDAVILTGGRTSPRRRDSEAAVMRQALSSLLPGLPLLVEEEAMTTLDNLILGRELARRSLGAVQRFVVFCDSVHRVKVGVLARILLRAREVISVPRHVPLWVRAMEPVSIVCESVGAFVPQVRRLIRALAMRVKGVSAPRPARATRRSARRAAA